MDRLPRRERERLRHRQEILEAARKVIAARGLEGVTVEHVAREAEFAVGSIYRHFRSKEELIEHLLIDLAEPLFEELEALPRSGRPFEEQLTTLIRVAHAHQVENLPVVQAFLSAPGSFPVPGTASGQRMQEIWMRFFAALDGVIRVGQAEGALAAGPPLPMVIALSGLMSNFTNWTLFGFAPLADDVPALVARAFLDGFRAR